MMFRCSHAVLWMLFFVSSSGCNVSLQSSQFTFVKNLLKAEPPVAEKNWQVTWGERNYLVYAVNHSDGIYFANESGLIVSFDGWQVTSLSLPSSRNKKSAQIRKTVRNDGGISLQYEVADDRNVARHRCSSWRPVAPQNVAKGWDQQCEHGRASYTNEIRVNEQNEVVALKHVVMPGETAIVIEQR
ncbi:MAG: hypothetical protein ACJ0RB_08545 [Candidatus Azotimanducaceae bacterium]